MKTASPRSRSFPLRALGFLVFILYFLRALVIANLQLAWCILFERNTNLAPGFLTYPVEQLSKLEILVLSHCITLTPGTATVKISADFTRLTLHALDARDPEGTLSSIRHELEAPMLRWTR